MTNQEFNAYVYEQKRQGRSESQIARSLGMSLAHFMGRLNGVDVDKVDPQKNEKRRTKLPPPEKVAEGVYRELKLTILISERMPRKKNRNPKKISAGWTTDIS